MSHISEKKEKKKRGEARIHSKRARSLYSSQPSIHPAIHPAIHPSSHPSIHPSGHEPKVQRCIALCSFLVSLSALCSNLIIIVAAFPLKASSHKPRMKSLSAFAALATLALCASIAQAQRSPLPSSRVLGNIFTKEGVEYLEGFQSPKNTALSALIDPLYNELDAAWWR